MYTNRSRGFTLIELLVVIAIIGILSAVVLASLNTARQKGSDAAIQANLNSIRTQAELEYSNYNQYAAAAIASNVCPITVIANSMWDATVVSALAQAKAQAGNVYCNVSIGPSGAYAVWAPLVSASGKYYCIDSNGNGVTLAAAPTSGWTKCQ